MPFLSVNGISLHYHVSGNGTPILCIHPPLLTGENFNYQKAQLSDRYKIITFDIRGHGASAPSKQTVTYPLIVEDMKSLLDALNIEKAYLLGYSTGGSIALEAMLTYPDRFVGSIIVSGMSEFRDFYNKFRLKLAAVLSNRFTKRLIAAAITWGNSDMAYTRKNLFTSAMHGSIQNIREYYQYSLAYNCTDKLRRIHQPVLLVYGDKDSSFFSYARTLYEGLPNSKVQIIKNVKHQIPTKAAAQLNDLIRLWVELQQEHIEGPAAKNAEWEENLHHSPLIDQMVEPDKLRL